MDYTSVAKTRVRNSNSPDVTHKNRDSTVRCSMRRPGVSKHMALQLKCYTLFIFLDLSFYVEERKPEILHKTSLTFYYTSVKRQYAINMFYMPNGQAFAIVTH